MAAAITTQRQAQRFTATLPHLVIYVAVNARLSQYRDRNQTGQYSRNKVKSAAWAAKTAN
jgi:hypothetical protein